MLLSTGARAPTSGGWEVARGRGAVCRRAGRALRYLRRGVPSWAQLWERGGADRGWCRCVSLLHRCCLPGWCQRDAWSAARRRARNRGLWFGLELWASVGVRCGFVLGLVLRSVLALDLVLVLVFWCSCWCESSN